MLLLFTSTNYRKLSNFNHRHNSGDGKPEPPKWKTFLLWLAMVVAIVIIATLLGG